MKRASKVYLTIGIFVIVLAALTVVFFAFQKGKSNIYQNSIEGRSNAVTALPSPGNATSVILDFADCSRGGTGISFGLGSTHFAFEGIRDGNCLFYVGTEIESPNWDGLLDTKCAVPISLVQKEFPISAYGIEFGNFLELYCKNSRSNN